MGSFRGIYIFQTSRQTGGNKVEGQIVGDTTLIPKKHHKSVKFPPPKKKQWDHYQVQLHLSTHDE